MMHLPIFHLSTVGDLQHFPTLEGAYFELYRKLELAWHSEEGDFVIEIVSVRLA
jgi:hypothetical protein